MAVYLYPLLSVVVVSLVSFVGLLTLSFKEEVLRKYIYVLVSLAVGALLGDAFIHLIPEAFETIGNPTTLSLLIIAGIFVFFVLEKVLHWHHHPGFEDHEHHPLGYMILVTDGLHNFIDGLIIGASYLVSIEVGIATTIAVVIHEIPQEIGDFGVLLHSGYTKAKALWLNFVSALLAVAGAALALLLGSKVESLTTWLLPLAAGGFIYIALSDLIPELHKTSKLKYSIVQLIAIAVGVAAMTLLLLLEG